VQKYLTYPACTRSSLNKVAHLTLAADFSNHGFRSISMAPS